MGKLVLAYDVKANNKTSQPRAFYELYIGPNDEGTSHLEFQLSTKQIIITPRCKPVPVPMPDDVIEVVDKIRKDKGIPDRIHFNNIHKE